MILVAQKSQARTETQGPVEAKGHGLMSRKYSEQAGRDPTSKIFRKTVVCILHVFLLVKWIFPLDIHKIQLYTISSHISFMFCCFTRPRMALHSHIFILTLELFFSGISSLTSDLSLPQITGH